MKLEHVLKTSLVALVLAVSAAGARAAPPDPGVPSMKVMIRDLNLSTDAGLATLYKRIQRAARMVCDASVWTGDPQGRHHWWRCYEATVADAVAKLNDSRLTALYEQKSGHKRPG